MFACCGCKRKEKKTDDSEEESSEEKSEEDSNESNESGPKSNSENNAGETVELKSGETLGVTNGHIDENINDSDESSPREIVEAIYEEIKVRKNTKEPISLRNSTEITIESIKEEIEDSEESIPLEKCDDEIESIVEGEIENSKTPNSPEMCGVIIENVEKDIENPDELDFLEKVGETMKNAGDEIINEEDTNCHDGSNKVEANVEVDEDEFRTLSPQTKLEEIIESIEKRMTDLEELGSNENLENIVENIPGDSKEVSPDNSLKEMIKSIESDLKDSEEKMESIKSPEKIILKESPEKMTDKMKASFKNFGAVSPRRKVEKIVENVVDMMKNQEVIITRVESPEKDDEIEKIIAELKEENVEESKDESDESPESSKTESEDLSNFKQVVGKIKESKKELKLAEIVGELKKQVGDFRSPQEVRKEFEDYHDYEKRLGDLHDENDKSLLAEKADELKEEKIEKCESPELVDKELEKIQDEKNELRIEKKLDELHDENDGNNDSDSEETVVENGVEETEEKLGPLGISGENLKTCKIALEEGVVGPPKSGCLFEAPAYIERTMVDGPDEDGDDSVFEGSITSEDLPAVPDPRLLKTVTRWLSQEDDDLDNLTENSGMQEPPATPVAKDELALRRHRFFADLLTATSSSAIHKVHFDPLGPLMMGPGCDNEREDHFEELVTRLENVTKRLESVPEKFLVETQEVAIQTQTPSPKRSNFSSNRSSEDSESTEDTVKIVKVIEAIPKGIISPVNMSVANYEDIVAGPVTEFLQLSQKIGGDVASHSKLVEKAFQIQLQFIKTAASRPAPSSQSEQVSLLGPTSTQIQAIQEFREKNRGSQFFNHLSAISESIPALGWVAVSPTPAPYVKEMNDAGQFYTNRVLKDWKEKDKKHVEWCKAWVQTLTELQKYVRQYHTTGLVWAKTGSAPVPPPPSGMPPPPPPCMPVSEFQDLDVNDDRSALFAQINQGENITKSLKKVTSDMQTHKNTSLRTGPAPFKAPVVGNSASPMKTTLPANAPIDKPPVFHCDGKKWIVEYQKGNKNLLIENAEMSNVVYMYRCQDSTLVIKGKINSVVMDSCRKSSVVFDSLVSSIEFVNCQSVQMQVLGKVPTISVDKTDGCQIYLNPESLNVEVFSSKSSEMNIMVPKGNGDYTEYPVPEQFKTTISPKGLSTLAVDSLG